MPRTAERLTSTPYWSTRVKSGASSPTPTGADAWTEASVCCAFVMAPSVAPPPEWRRNGGQARPRRSAARALRRHEPGRCPVGRDVDLAAGREPRRRGGLLDLAGVHMARATRLGGQQ